jgi:hypothetical protein
MKIKRKPKLIMDSTDVLGLIESLVLVRLLLARVHRDPLLNHSDLERAILSLDDIGDVLQDVAQTHKLKISQEVNLLISNWEKIVEAPFKY